MSDYSFLFGPLGVNEQVAREGAPRPDEIAAVMSEWRREGLAIELPKARTKEAQRRDSAFNDLLREFPVQAITKEGVYHCPKCIRTVTLRALEKKQCTECGGVLTEQRAAEVFQIGDSIGAQFISQVAPPFHLSVDTLIRTLDLPRWFLQLGPHMRDMRRIPVNFANFGIMLLLGLVIPWTIFALGSSFFRADAAERLLWRGYSSAGAVATILLLVLRPYVQSYVTVGREKIMLVVMGQRQVLHFQNITTIRNERRLNGWGYAAVLGREWGQWAAWVYGVMLQWFDPRNWFGLYPNKLMDRLPPGTGGPESPYFRNRVILRGERRVLRIPFNGKYRRDLTQALAVVVFQVRSMSPHAKIDVTALQIAQRSRATQEQWTAGVRR